ncbi:MAG: DUF4293 domain-containing protein [Saprospiraceae bacterium]|jgi:hypothetical protein|nr:DUF4293 domain-containing protein [Candidatus Parvibacillus calidus]MBX2936114.1 DUF4293 domain-containing protein [Saprospiraceae bacterium]MBX7178194.1 DUF4293 domain-containing protein [Saprospiraceae bacterium]MCB0590797.1 DUF4293 domain-containing protein [Saprospiraceae bacterium]MCO6470057.1 DUF4293 domain-containing protein [Saprospiraceae bacterium]
MIQRIQTIFLLLASACISFLFLPNFDFAASDSAQAGSGSLFQDGVFNAYDNLILQVLIGAISALIFINIFLFKKRELQLLLSKLIIIMVFGIILFAGIIFYLNFENRQEEMVHIQVKLGLFIPFVVLALLFLANKHIKKDIRLVKSMDRLR